VSHVNHRLFTDRSTPHAHKLSIYSFPTITVHQQNS
jgi:hypothetical protein